METFFALLAICAGNSPASGEFPAQRPVTRSFDVFFDLCLNKRLRKQSWGWWFRRYRAHYDVIVINCRQRCPGVHELTHWGRLTRQSLVIQWLVAYTAPSHYQNHILSIWILGTNLKFKSKPKNFLFKKMRLKMSSAKWRPFCLGLRVLTDKTCQE